MQKDEIYDFLINALPEAEFYECGDYLLFSSQLRDLCDKFAMTHQRCGGIITNLIAKRLNVAESGFVCDFDPILDTNRHLVGYVYHTYNFEQLTEQKLSEIVEHIRIVIAGLLRYAELKATYELIKEINNL